MPGEEKVDWAPIWQRELTVVGAYAYGAEPKKKGKRTFQLALEAAPEVHLETLTGPLFGLGEYRDAIAYAMSAGRLGAVKVAFDLRGLKILMGRPGAVIEVDRNTPPVLFHYGEGVRLEKLPFGARIVYPPDPLDAIAHPERAIRRALAKPLEDDPLKSLLRKGMKLTIAFDDLSLPLPPMAAPDVRQLVMCEGIELWAKTAHS